MLEVSEIKRLIDEDASSVKKRLAKIGQRYYEGDHDIKGYKMFYYNSDGELCEDTTRSNQKIIHPFFTELADQLTAFILSSAENPIHSDAEGLQEHLDKYFDEDFWGECADVFTGAYVKGFDYLYAFKTGEKIAFQFADSMGVVEVREKDTDAGCKCFIYWYVDRIEKGKKEIRRIQVHTEKDITFYVQSGDTGKIELDADVLLNPQPNVLYKNNKTGGLFGAPLGFLPFFRLDYNKKQFSGLKPIKALIDDYDLMQCGLSNNLQDFDHPIHVVKGYEGTDLDELQQNLKTKKTVGVGENGGLDIMTVNVPYQARKTKADEDEKNIYRFGMGLNTQGLKDTTATTNIAIKTAYSLLELKAKLYIRRSIKKFLKQIIKVVIDDINTVNGTAYQISDVEIDFIPETTVNETENVANEKVKAETQQIILNNILSVAAYIGDEETLKAICDNLDLDFEELQAKIEKAKKEESLLSDAQNSLNNAVVEDETPIDDGEGGDEE